MAIDPAILVKAGYLVISPTPVPGQSQVYRVDPTGVADSTAGIQQAIDDACLNFMHPWLPNKADDSQAEYRISAPLRFYMFYNSNDTICAETSGHCFTFATNAQGLRPLIKIADVAPVFDSPSPSGFPMPMVAVRAFSGGGALPSNMAFDPWGFPPGWGNGAADVWDGLFLNFNLDTNGHKWAGGVIMAGAQTVYYANFKVKATGSVFCFGPGPGNGSTGMNLEAIDGQFGVAQHYAYHTSWWEQNDPTIEGLTCTGQTNACFTPGGVNGGPSKVWGAKFQPAAGGVAFRNDLGANWTNLMNHAAFYNAEVIGTGGGTAFPNVSGADLYLGEVYVSGFANVTQFKTLPPRPCSGTWTHVQEYCSASEMAGPIHVNNTNGNGPWPTYSCIDSVVTPGASQPEPIVNIQGNAPAPPANLLSRHIVTLPMIDTTPYIDIRDHGAVPLTIPGGSPPGGPTHNYQCYIAWDQHDQTGVTDCAPAINAAIAAAPVGTAVLIPLGNWEFGAQIKWGDKTQVIGLGRRRSVLTTHRSWVPTSMTPVFVTPPSGNACGIVNIGLNLRRAVGAYSSTTGYANDYFTWMLWQCGGESFTFGFWGDLQWVQQMKTNSLVTKPLLYNQFIGPNAGGRFYGLSTASVLGQAANANARPHYLNGTRQPMYFYSLNCESSKNTGVTCDVNLEAVNCQNVRVLGVKREGSGNSVWINGCENFGFFGSCRLACRPEGYTLVKGGSANVLAFHHSPFGDTTSYNNFMLVDDGSNGHPAVHLEQPKALAVYKIGELNDAAMVIATPPCC